MLFNSWGYLVLLALFVPLHWALPDNRSRQPLLCVLSVSFYAMWRWDFALLVLFSAALDYFCSLGIASSGIRAGESCCCWSACWSTSAC
jgi:D-alanyl-lipoteichoic acid acyltransferase DltB (MBOAT superfamily)